MSGLRVVLVKAPGIASRAIEWFGGGGYSHFATVIPFDPDHVVDARSDVIDGIPAGVQLRPLEYLRQYDCTFLDVPARYSQLKAVDRLLESQIGRPYDKLGIWHFVTGQVHDRNWRDESAWFCSELGIWVQEGAGICRPLGTGVNRITPGAAYLIDRALGARVIKSPFA